MRSIVDASKLDLKATIVSIRRVAKTVKGGRNMRFSVTVVVGDGDGDVGGGLGKAQEIPEAVRKAKEDAKKNLIDMFRPWEQLYLTRTWAFSAQAEYSHAGGTRYWSYRRLIGAYSSRSCRYQGCKSEVNRL